MWEDSTINFLYVRLGLISIPDWIDIKFCYSSDNIKHLKSSFEFDCPIIPPVVRKYGMMPDGEGTYSIIDGVKRLIHFDEIGRHRIPVINVGAIEDNEARILRIALNWSHGERNKKELASILKLLDKEITEKDEVISFLKFLPFRVAFLDKLIDRLEGKQSRGKPEVEETESNITFNFKLPRSAATVVQRAFDQVRKVDSHIDRNSALEFICADYLSGVSNDSK